MGIMSEEQIREVRGWLDDLPSIYYRPGTLRRDLSEEENALDHALSNLNVRFIWFIRNAYVYGLKENAPIPARDAELHDEAKDIVFRVGGDIARDAFSNMLERGDFEAAIGFADSLHTMLLCVQKNNGLYGLMSETIGAERQVSSEEYDAACERLREEYGIETLVRAMLDGVPPEDL